MCSLDQGRRYVDNITNTENSFGNFAELPPLIVLMQDRRWKSHIILRYICIQKDNLRYEYKILNINQ